MGNYIDSHQHFWIFDPVRDSWIDNEMKVIQRDFLPEDLEPVLDENGFVGCVAVQASQTEEENSFLLQLAEEGEIVKGVVGWVDLQSEQLEDRLSFYAEREKMKGFRHVLQGETQRDLMLTPAFRRGISKLKAFNFTYDILIFRDQLNFASQLAQEFPDQPFVLDHISKPDIKNQDIKEWERDIRNLAKAENVSCKVSGMVTEADWKHWKPEDFTPYLDVVFDAFGIERLMYGSDWPVCNVAGGYGKALEILKDYCRSLSSNEQSLFFGENAIKFYNL